MARRHPPSCPAFSLSWPGTHSAASLGATPLTSETSSLKIASLLLRTLSKPIATKIKQQAKEHEGFKGRTIHMAQFLHRAECVVLCSLWHSFRACSYPAQVERVLNCLFVQDECGSSRLMCKSRCSRFRDSQLRVKLLGESPRHVRPLSESKAIDAGANFLSEGVRPCSARPYSETLANPHYRSFSSQSLR